MDEWQWIAVFLGNLVQASEVDAKAEGSIFLAGKEYRSSMRGARGPNETSAEMLINEFSESLELYLR